MNRQLWIILQLTSLLLSKVLFGSEITLAWNPNDEEDLAGYKVYYGKTSKVYTNVRWVGDRTSYSVKNLKDKQRYYFAVTAVDLYGNESEFSKEVDILILSDNPDDPNEESPPDPDNETQGVFGDLVYNYPNPLRVGEDLTRIRYELKDAVDVTIEIFDINMNEVKRIITEAIKLPGTHTEDLWDGTNEEGQYVSNGTYFCRLKTGNEQRLIKIAVIR